MVPALGLALGFGVPVLPLHLLISEEEFYGDEGEIGLRFLASQGKDTPVHGASFKAGERRNIFPNFQ